MLADIKEHSSLVKLRRIATIISVMNVIFKDIPLAGSSLLETWWAHEKQVWAEYRMPNEIQGQLTTEDKGLL